MANYGIKIGDDIENDTNRELQLTTKYSTLKLFTWGNTQFTTNGSGEGSVTISHDLNYKPIPVVFRKHTAQWSSPETVLPTTSYTNAYSHLGTLNWYAGGDTQSKFESVVSNDDLIIRTKIGQSASANTTYYFRYYILVDLAQAFSSASNISLTGDYGFKVAKPGKNVLTGEEYEMAYSSKYKALQYYNEYVRSDSFTLPEMFASPYDEDVEEACYIDFEHDFDYPPFYFAYMSIDNLTFYPLPFSLYNSNVTSYNGHPELNFASFSDSNRVRVYAWRGSSYQRNVGYANMTTTFSSQTYYFKCIIFSEDLSS